MSVNTIYICNALVMQVKVQIIVLLNVKTILENHIMTLNMVQTSMGPTAVPSAHTELYIYGSSAFTHFNISPQHFMHPHFKSSY